MAEEKKPNLKDRLKKPAAHAAAAAAPVAAGAAAPLVPPAGVVPPPVAVGGSIPAPPIAPVPGIPGLGDVAPPAFVQQQQAAAEAARRAQAAAEDPFGAAAVAAPPAQEVRLVIDEKPVDDREVGRKRSGSIIAIAVTGVIALVAGYAVGNMMEAKAQERQTLQAMEQVRSSAANLSSVIQDARSHIDHAIEAGNIQMRQGDEGGEGGAAPAVTHPPDVDEELITWFASQPSDPPFSPDVYAGRVGRLRANIVQKITVVQLQLNELWRELRRHQSSTRVADVRQAIRALDDRAQDNQQLNSLAVVFTRNQAGAALAQIGVAAPAGNNQQGALVVNGPGITGNATRTMYQTGDITSGNLTTLAFPIVYNQGGVVSRVRAAAILPWAQYTQRVRDLKSLVDGLAQSHQQLMEALGGRGSH